MKPIANDQMQDETDERQRFDNNFEDSTNSIEEFLKSLPESRD